MHCDIVGAPFLATVWLGRQFLPFQRQRKSPSQSADERKTKFDDVPVNPLAGVIPIPTPYDGLAYPIFDARANGVSILKARSSNNSAFHVPSNNLFASATITANYTGSEVEYFDMDSTYSGCAVRTEAFLGIPEPYAVQFNSTKTDGEVVSEKRTYAGTTLSPALVVCTFPTLKFVKSVNLTVIQSATLDLTVVYLDNVAGVLFSSS